MSQFYFAWVLPSETTFGTEHEREDEQVLSFDLSHSEGEFASLKIDIKNPRIGLLSRHRKQWCWLAWRDGTEVTPLFFGRIIGVPSDLQNEVITLEFLARPIDFEAQRATLAASLRVLPYYDPVWLNSDARANDDMVLQGYTKLWHTNPTTHVVTTSDVLVGEDGTIDFEGGFIRDSLSVRYDKVPGRKVKVTGAVQWDQEVAGTLNFSPLIIKAFHTIGGYNGNWYTIGSFTGEGLMEDWPKKGDNVGAGWTVGLSEAHRVDGLVNNNGEQVVEQYADGEIFAFPMWTFLPVFWCDYKATRSKSETVTFTLEADVQPLLTDPGDQELIQLNASSTELENPIDAGGLMPIRDVRRRSYFQSDRGWQSIENLIAQARALLVIRSRAVVLEFDVPWDVGLTVSLRKSARLIDARLPAGHAAGKIVTYTLSANGDSGKLNCHVAVGCAIGRGGVVTDAAGDPLYVDDGYVDDHYQTRVDRVIMPIAGEVTYTPPDGITINDDGLEFSNLKATDVLLPIDGTHTEPDEPGIDVIFGPGAQKFIIKPPRHFARQYLDVAIAAMNEAYTQIRVNLKPLTVGPFEQTYPITVSELKIPRVIDLEADRDGDEDTSTATELTETET